jgi:hypothetical protein
MVKARLARHHAARELRAARRRTIRRAAHDQNAAAVIFIFPAYHPIAPRGLGFWKGEASVSKPS